MGICEMDNTEKCFLCGQNPDSLAHIDQFDTCNVQCRRCGTYRIAGTAIYTVRGNNPFLQAAARQASEMDRPLLITTENWERLIEEHSSTGILENMEKLLNHVARHCKRPGNTIGFEVAQDYPIIDAQDANELRWHVGNAESAGYIKREGASKQFSLTAAGWDYLLGSSAGGVIPGRCFVAMSFSTEHEGIYYQGIKPAVEAAGYNPVWMKSVLTNEDICYRMVAEIRKAQFLVADFTGSVAGVYFEAGLALGAHREVFWTAHADEFENKKIHFDTNHYQHIIWNDHAQLKKDLEEKIVAILGYGPNKS